jgi:hypothetical protein
MVVDLDPVIKWYRLTEPTAVDIVIEAWSVMKSEAFIERSAPAVASLGAQRDPMRSTLGKKPNGPRERR